MPTLLIINGLRFFFYSNENNEPVHVHVVKGGSHGKVWLEPTVQVAYFNGFSTSEQIEIMKVIRENLEDFKQKWYAYFGK